MSSTKIKKIGESKLIVGQDLLETGKKEDREEVYKDLKQASKQSKEKLNQVRGTYKKYIIASNKYDNMPNIEEILNSD